MKKKLNEINIKHDIKKEVNEKNKQNKNKIDVTITLKS